MIPNKPTISVVCPTYNSAKYIVRTLKAVLDQDYLPHELIISDDGSSDETLEIIRKFISENDSINIVAIENQHLGPGAARNAGIRQATGEWLAFLDSDDFWFKNKISCVLAAIADNPGKNFFSHYEERQLLNGDKIMLCHGNDYDAAHDLGKQLYFKNFFSTSAVVCKKELLLEHGLFDERLMTSQDYELWLRLADSIKPYFMSQVLGRYIDRPDNVTSSKITRRLKNSLKICVRHRKKVNFILFTVKIIQIVRNYSLIALKLLFSRLNHSR